MRWGMVIDLERCIGCYACQMTCKLENRTPRHMFWNLVLQREEGQFPTVRRFYLPLACMHCKNPACVEVCPTGASYRRDDGIVMIDHDKCIGCKACMLACPYDVRQFNERGEYYFGIATPMERDEAERKRLIGTVEKCTFCAHRLERGEEPACISVCPCDARKFGDLDDPESEVSKLIKAKYGFRLREDLGQEPAVYYLPAAMRQNSLYGWRSEVSIVSGH